MTKKEALIVARGHLAQALKLSPTQAPLAFSNQNPAFAEDCHWFSFGFPHELRLGAGQVIGIRKADGSVAYCGTDGGE
jgi:hypothetical protein